MAGGQGCLRGDIEFCLSSFVKKSVKLLLILTAVLLVFYWIYLPVITKYHDLKMEQKQLGRQIADLDAKIKALETERELLKNDPQYLERVIRKEMGLVKPGEVVYKIAPAEEQKTSSN